MDTFEEKARQAYLKSRPPDPTGPDPIELRNMAAVAPPAQAWFERMGITELPPAYFCTHMEVLSDISRIFHVYTEDVHLCWVLEGRLYLASWKKSAPYADRHRGLKVWMQTTKELDWKGVWAADTLEQVGSVIAREGAIPRDSRFKRPPAPCLDRWHTLLPL